MGGNAAYNNLYVARVGFVFFVVNSMDSVFLWFIRILPLAVFSEVADADRCQ